MRKTFRERQIPTGVESAIYQDPRQIVRHLGSLLTETYLAKVTGAGGAGGVIEGVPFEPAVIQAFRITDTAAFYKSVLATDGALHLQVIAAAGENDNPPTIEEQEDGTWNVTIPTQMAPNDAVVVVEIRGSRAVEGSL
jgi:hypothetical protein